MLSYSFMVMPFGRRPTQAESGKVPSEVDFNALWDKAFYPMLAELGYKPIRADQETGSLIINQMLERLYFSDLVLVDLTAPNGNVYYEMGIRQAACRSGCVLLAAEGTRPLFDVAQMRMVRYPLPFGEITDEMALAIRQAVAPSIAPMRSGTSPVFELLPGYPGPVDPSRAAGVRDQVEALATFQGDVRAARGAAPSQRLARFATLKERYRNDLQVPGIAIGLLRLLVFAIAAPEDWQQVLDYIDTLPEDTAAEAFVREQRALALGKLGRSEDAIDALMALVESAGATSEREGLIGGRCKELWRAARKEGREADAAHWLDRAIDHYERGMALDLNDFYPSSNLPRLYRERDAPGDAVRALTALHVAGAACQRALDRGSTDEWVRPTLLGVQFDIPDPDKAEDLVRQVRREGAGAWKIQTTLQSLRESAVHAQDDATRHRLEAVLEQLARVG